MRRTLALALLLATACAAPQAPQQAQQPQQPPPVQQAPTTPPVAPPPAVGQPPPAFDLPVVSADTPETRTFRLADTRGPVVLLFFPEAATPGCTRELCEVRDRYEGFVEYGATVLAVSADPPQKLRQWAQQQKFPFLLGSDPEGEVATLYGSWAGDEPRRTMFVLAAAGTEVLYREMDFDLNDIPGELEAARKHLVKG